MSNQPLAKSSTVVDDVEQLIHREASREMTGSNKNSSPTEADDDQSWAKYTNFQIL